MPVRYESNPRSLPYWLTEIKQRRLVLPRFQRMQAWGPSQVQDLLQSVIDGLPVGAILLLEVLGEPQFAYRTIAGAKEEGEPVREMILDGQQRLTALWRALNDDYWNDPQWRDRFFLRITDDGKIDPEDLPIVERVRHYSRNGKRYPLWTSDSEQVYERGLIPISILNPDKARESDEWVEEVTTGKPLKVYKALNKAVAKHREAVRSFQIPYIRLAAGTEPDAIITTFTRVNTQGTPLSPFDLVVARMEKHDIKLHQLSDTLWTNVPALKRFSRVDDLDILRALVLLEGKKPTRSNVLLVDPNHLRKRWSDLEQGTRRALDFLRDEMIFDGDRIPTEPILPVLFALWTDVPEGGIEEGNAQTLLREYVWRAFFSDRYERAANTAVLQDYRALRETLRGTDVVLPFRDALLPENPDGLLEAGWPRRRDRLGRAILCATLRGQAKDIYDGKPITATNIQSREYHHLFPKAYLRDRGAVEDDIADRALNVALVTWKTNRQISAASPRKYLVDAAGRIVGDDDVLGDRLRSHLIPIEPFLNEDYDAFLTQRAELIFEGMEALIEGKDWRPAG